MKTNVYAIFDRIADETVVLGISKTDGLFCRQNIPYVSKINENYLKDFEVRCVGYISDSDGIVHSPDDGKFRVVPWDSYKKPESVASIDNFNGKNSPV